MHIGLVLRNLPISKANHCREELWVEETGNKGWTQEGKNLVENTGSSTYRDVDVPNHDMLPSNTQRALTRWKMSGSKGARRRGGAFRGGRGRGDSTSEEALRRGLSDWGVCAGNPDGGGMGGRGRGVVDLRGSFAKGHVRQGYYCGGSRRKGWAPWRGQHSGCTLPQPAPASPGCKQAVQQASAPTIKIPQLHNGFKCAIILMIAIAPHKNAPLLLSHPLAVYNQCIPSSG
jgi:hypothetical protein